MAEHNRAAGWRSSARFPGSTAINEGRRLLMGITTVKVENKDNYCIRFTVLSAEQVKEPLFSATPLKNFA